MESCSVTDDPEAWHRENLERNPAHYSSLLRWVGGGARPIAWLQTHTGARIFFNTLVPFEDGLIKYGVIATEDLIADLVGEEANIITYERDIILRYSYS